MRSSRGFAVLLALSAGLHAGGLQIFEAVEPHMGTLVRIQLYAPGEPQAKAAFRAAFDRIAQLDYALSDYKPDSELNRISREAVGRPVKLSDDLFRVLAASQKLAEESDGAFDVTLGALTHLWRGARKTGQLPEPAALRDAAARTGYRKLHLDPANRTVMLDQPGMQLDVGGIAKGYAADAALAILEERGIHRALVAVSGDLAFGDPPPGQKGWRIDIGARVLELRNAAVSTSGDSEQHLDAGGKRYSHIIDPATGMGIAERITVTVVARRGINADPLATAVSIRGLGLMHRYPDARAYVSK